MAVLDSLLNKLEYTATSITGIGTAANEKGAGINLETDALATWADKIRNNITDGGQPSGVERTVTAMKIKKININDNILPRTAFTATASKEE